MKYDQRSTSANTKAVIVTTILPNITFPLRTLKENDPLGFGTFCGGVKTSGGDGVCGKEEGGDDLGGGDRGGGADGDGGGDNKTEV
jgi:uncharacterized membrane protein YgcG